MTKLPPIEKVYEAWTAVADNRVQFDGPDRATVTSSDGAKTYTVVCNPETDTYYSDDNATYWRGYPGYPILAVMMERGVLPLDMGFAHLWTGINWNRLNSEYKRNYGAAVDQVEQERGIDPELAARKASEVMTALENLPARTKRLTL